LNIHYSLNNSFAAQIQHLPEDIFYSKLQLFDLLVAHGDTLVLVISCVDIRFALMDYFVFLHFRSYQSNNSAILFDKKLLFLLPRRNERATAKSASSHRRP